MSSNKTDVFIGKRNQESVHTDERPHEDTATQKTQEDSYQKPPCLYLDIGLPASRIIRK